MTPALICRFDPAARLLVRGPDAATFLQGQFTNELRRNEARPCTYGLWLNQKGRVLADSFVLGRGAEAFAVVSLLSTALTIRERLEAYIIADDVAVEEGTVGAAGWVIAGAGGEELLSFLGLAPPSVGEFSEHEAGVCFRSRAAGGANWLLCASPESRGEWEARVSESVRAGRARVGERAEFELQRIEAGVPSIPLDLGPGDLPMEGGLEHEALSFTKGCYLGQEVMARLHHMGQVRRRLHVVGLPAGVNASPGAPLFRDERSVGDLRSVARHADTVRGLAMLHQSHVQPGDVLALGAGEAPCVRVERVAEGRAW